MNGSRIFFLTAVLATLVTAGVVHGQSPDRRGGPGGRGPGGARAAGLPVAELNLSDEQRAQFRALSEQYRTQAQPVVERLNAARAAQRKAVETMPADEGLIRSTTQELAEAQTEVAIHQARLRGELFALLTPEQQAQATRLLAERKARGQQPHHRQRKQN
jgi:Spy/CpxP family protein refolding chaperone